MTFTSYSQNFEDVILKRAFKNIKSGLYIDVGAHDPIKGSVTKLFYESGWRGINIEPVEHWHNMICCDRPEDINLNIAATSIDGSVKFYEIIDTGLSTSVLNYAEHYKKLGYKCNSTIVQSKQISTICSELELKEIHFLKIDVEGGEEEVLKGTDFYLTRPWVIIVEATEPLSSSEKHFGWEDILLSNNYEEIYYDGLNRFYLANEHADLKPAFSLPPNVFDDFIKFEHIEALVHVQQLQDEIKTQRLRYEREMNLLRKKIKALSG